MTLSEITGALELWAPREYQESYDNSRLLFGDPQSEIKSALICLDITEKQIDEALANGCDLIIAHHPLIFKGIKSLSPRTDAERALIKAIQNNIALYALHTNLDNVASGVNAEIGRRLGFSDMKILAPKRGLLHKLVVYVPENSWQTLAEALWEAGAGSIGNYDECSFRAAGKGTFRPSSNANPSIGEIGQRHEEGEFRLECIIESDKVAKVLKAMQANHPYEEVAYDLFSLENEHAEIGSGMIADLKSPVAVMDFLKLIKETFGGIVRFTKPPKSSVQRVAWCGGSGSFLLGAAKAQKADLFLSSDFKYHQFFEAENEILIADIGHYENEQFTIDLIAEYLRKKFPTFAVLLTENSTNPINYL